MTERSDGDARPTRSPHAFPRTPRAIRSRFSLVALLAIVLVFWVGGNATGFVDQVRESLAKAGLLAPALYVGVIVLTYVIAPLRIPGLSVTAGLLFGIWLGAALTVIGDSLGGSVNFWISRLLGRATVARFAGAQALERVDALSGRFGGWRGLLFARLVLPGYDFVSYGAGLTPLDFRTYLLVTAVAGIPPALVHVAIGATAAADPFLTLLASAAFAALYGIGFYALWLWRRRSRQATSKDEPR